MNLKCLKMGLELASEFLGYITFHKGMVDLLGCQGLACNIQAVSQELFDAL